MSDDFSYGPPVTVVGSGTRAADASGTTVTIAGGANQPDPGATTQAPVGGAPTEASGKKFISTTVSISPTGAVHGAANATVTVTGTLFSPNSKVLYGGTIMPTTYVSATSLTFLAPVAARPNAGVVTVGVQTGARITSTVNFTYT